MKRLLALLLILSLLIVSAAGCAAQNEPAASDTPAAEKSDAPVAKESADEENSDELKVGETLTIGVATAVSGSSALLGEKFALCMPIFEKELEAMGGGIINGDTLYPIEFVTEDTEGKEEICVNAYNKLIHQEDAIAVVGPDSSKLILAAGPVAQSAGCVAIGTFSTNEAVTQIGDFLFRACFIDPFQGEVLARYAIDAGYKKAAILYNNADSYSTGLYTVFAEKFAEFGGEVVAAEAYAGAEIKDYSAQLTKIAAADAEILILPNAWPELPLQTQQAREMGIDLPFLGGDSWQSANLIDVAGAEIAEGAVFVSAFSDESTDPAYLEFVELWESVHGVNESVRPDATTVLFYEAMHLVWEGIRTAETVDRQGVRDAMAKIENLVLPTGSITMDENRNPIKGAVVLQYGEGGTKHLVTTINPE